ncbi:MAG TPA: ATP-grasp domain-containing protein [Kofleriaceae bacterium]|nr:ATP-grasp domain-containing protein [Kofleriaceae bacterium]
MKVAFTYNLRRTDSEEEAEFDTAETVDAIADAIESAGHEVDKIEVSGPAATLLERLEASDPDIIFNTAEGRGGRMREAFYPALFEEIGVPYTGSDAYTMAVTLDKWLTKLVLLRHGIDTPRGRLINVDNLATIAEQGPGLAFPIIVKPNYEGSSKGIQDDSVANDFKELMTLLKAAVKAYPDGVLMEEYIEGVDISVGFVNGVGLDDGLLAPVEFMFEPSRPHGFTVYDYVKKNIEPNAVRMRCPASVPRDVAARLRAISHDAIKGLGLKDIARLDFRVADDGRIYLLEANALPSLSRGSSIFAATAQLGLSYDQTIAAVLNAAALRANVATAHELGLRHKRRGRHRPVRVGFTYNVKRTHDSDEHAEFDPPETIIAISNALARQGFIVVHLEATPDLPRVLAEADVDLIFNIAEGVEGRNREAQVPALCELLGIPYTGSDSATLAIALDKALCKKVLSQHGILTPKFQVMETGRERLDGELKFPLIVKPNAEGSSKGIGTASVVDSEEELRAKVTAIIDRYKQPALVEEYIHGREFTVGLLGSKRRLRVLPPMEIRFKDEANERPVYDYVVKQEWEKHVEYECPAKLTEAENRAIEKVARATFAALECRDFARVDLRMAPDGKIYVFEVNPLPGMTPGYSDLVLISSAAGMDYDNLMGEILVGGLRRLRDKRRREEQEEETRIEGAQAQAREQAHPNGSAGTGGGINGGSGNGNGQAGASGNGNGGGAEESQVALAAEKAERAAERAERAAKRMAKLARKRARSRRHANGNGQTGTTGNGQAQNGQRGETPPPTTH